jgi:hypothetical protein
MGVPILTINSTLICPHGGSVILQTSNVDMMVQGAPALLITDVHLVAGCPFFIGPKPSPCLMVSWVTAATLTKNHGIPVLLQNSIGICYSAEQLPQGPAIVVQTQPIALGL